MSQTEKSAYFQALKAAGIHFERHYREYSTAELKDAYEKLSGDATPLSPAPPPPPEHQHPNPPPPLPPPGEEDEQPPASFFFPPPPPQAAEPPAPTAPLNPTEMAGERLNTQDEDEPIRTDDEGRIWYQEEVRKPAYPKPRGRRVLTYMESGVEEQTVRVGDYIETFEVAGSGPAQMAEVKITLPSYQVGVYKDPRFPFKIHCYNGIQGFDLFAVQDFYGGAELVPQECKRIYVENVLCYDIRTTVRAIETEYRQLQLAGKID
jgi:hypothetical protein